MRGLSLAVAACVLLGAPATQVGAGHGMMNAFGDVQWLPDPGRTPDRFGYTLDGLAERARLALATDSEAFALALDFAREKLAETDAMVRAEKRDAALRAVAAYQDYLPILERIIATRPQAQATSLRERFAQALLEHRYIMSVDYLDLPKATRTVIGGVISAATEYYERTLAKLPRAFKAAQFFKEEEVRWAWETATQADAQGL